MPNSIIPTQLGYSAPSSSLGSQIFLGKDISIDFEAIGAGAEGRPDILESFKMNITLVSGAASNFTNTNIKIASFNITANDVRGLYTGNANFPANAEFRLRQFSVCEFNDVTQESEERNVALWACQTYATGAGNVSREY